jgi:methyl-accepting chemotaxis protein
MKNQIDKRRRLKIVVERDFQYRFTLKLCLLGGVVVIGFGVLFLFIMKLSYSTLLDTAIGKLPSQMIADLEREYRMIKYLVVAGLVAIIGALFGLGLVVSQKLAGPIVALQRRLRDFSEGKTGVRLTLRKDDEFQNIQTVFNSAMESFEDRYNQKIERVSEVYYDLLNKNTSAAQSKLATFLENEGKLAKLQ